jgi:oligoribonuclease
MDRLVWIDCEMTGLDLEQDRLIEVAVLITDGELNLIDEGLDLVIGAPAEVLDNMVPVVAEMHGKSGLTEAVRASTLTVAEAEQQVLDYVKQHIPERRRAPLCGNSIATDRSFLARDMKELDDFLHYRMVDVSSVKELAKRWYPRAYYASPEKKGGHRALADILESVEELRYYREAIFVPQPGPSSDEAKAIAAAISNGSGSSPTSSQPMEVEQPPGAPASNSEADGSSPV